MAIGSLLTAGLAIGGVAAGAATLAPLLRAEGIQQQAMASALEVVMSFPMDSYGVAGPASMQISRMNLLRRAQFVLGASRRIQAAMVAGRATGQPLATSITQAAGRERRYYSQHLQAIWNRAKAAAQVDSTASTFGLLLGWNTVLDRNTSAECKAADGRNFRADAMPLIGFPGAVHPHCRCYPGPAHPGARMLPSMRTARAVSAA